MSKLVCDLDRFFEINDPLFQNLENGLEVEILSIDLLKYKLKNAEENFKNCKLKLRPLQ